jgi:uncharacterized protein YndB with AHSA1/START domain
MEGSTDGCGYEHRDENLAIEPPSLLSFTWISKARDHTPTVVTIEFHERGTGTQLVLTHRRLAPKAVEGQMKWPAICETRRTKSLPGLIAPGLELEATFWGSAAGHGT